LWETVNSLKGRKNMTKKTMLITGGGRGIGAATALIAAKHGYAVAINYASNSTAATEVVEQIKGLGGDAVAIQGLVENEADVMKMFAAVDARWGRLDALINNAGVVAPKSRVDEMSLARLQNVFNINVLGSFLCAREAVKRMSQKHGGRGGAIVNISSAAARLGSPAEYVDYASSKGAIDTLTIGLSKEVAAEGIRVNAVRPGLINTEIHASGGQPDRVARFMNVIPMQRGGTAVEVANTIWWLVSDEASYVTGALIDVGGGR
jgi:NAD(P)-dependent dehydrogenase (short-subunit alcohol dehydrogenase family)